METKHKINLVLGSAVIIIGLVMIVKFYTVQPPLLSGIAFVLIGSSELVHSLSHKK